MEAVPADCAAEYFLYGSELCGRGDGGGCRATCAFCRFPGRAGSVRVKFDLSGADHGYQPDGSSIPRAKRLGYGRKHTGFCIKNKRVSIGSVLYLGLLFFKAIDDIVYLGSGTGSIWRNLSPACRLSYLFMGVSQIYQAVLKAAGQTGKSTLISSAALLLNLIFNAIFIFGLFGIPSMGVAGAALGTLLARGIEMAWCLLDSVWGKTVQIRWGRIFRRDKLLAKDFWKYTLPITLNGLSWGSAFASYSIIMGHLGSDVVAANSIATVARNFAMAGCNSLAAGAGIYLGALLGQDKFDEARTDSGKIMRLTLGMGVVGGILILLFQPFLLGISDLTPMAEQYLRMMIFINAAYVITQSINTMLNNGVFCAGGDTRFGLICDTIDMWCFSVPLGFICAFVLKLPPMAVYLVLCLDEGAKMPFMLGHYRKNKWLKNITIKMEEETYDNG